VRGKSLARVTVKAFILAVLVRLAAWQVVGGSIDHLWARVPWLMDATAAVLWMCAGNLLVFVTWNFAASLREADATIKRITEDVRGEAPYGLRPGGVHITTGPHLKYIVPAATLRGPAISGTGTLSACARHHDAPERGVSCAE
jgi:hypothetical protein